MRDRRPCARARRPLCPRPGRGRRPGGFLLAAPRRIEAGAFVVQAGERLIGVAGQGLLALDVGVDLGEPRLQFAARVLEPPLLGLEFDLGDLEAVQLGPGRGRGLAQRRQLGRGIGLSARRRGGRAFALGDRALGGVERALGVGHRLLPGLVAALQQERLGAADALVQPAVAPRLAGLTLEPLKLGLERAHHVVEALEVGLGGAQAQLGLVAPVVQTGDAGGLVQQRAPLARLGRDQRPHLALADQRGAARAGGLVGEQQLHLARQRLLAVDAVDRAETAIDAARDLDLAVLVVGGGGGAGGVVEQQPHLGVVARRPGGAAAEDDVVHLAAAHLAGRRLAHDPTQRVDEVRLAAAVGADNPRQARLDQKVGGLDERLKAGKPET